MCSSVLLGLDLGEDVGLAEDEQVLAVDLDLRAAVLGIEDLVPLRDVERNALLALVVEAALAHGDDLALLGLLLGRIGEDDAAGGRLLLLDRPHDEPVAQGLELHTRLTSGGKLCGSGDWHSRWSSANASREKIAHWHSQARSASVRCAWFPSARGRGPSQSAAQPSRRARAADLPRRPGR